MILIPSSLYPSARVNFFKGMQWISVLITASSLGFFLPRRVPPPPPPSFPFPRRCTATAYTARPSRCVADVFRASCGGRGRAGNSCPRARIRARAVVKRRRSLKSAKTSSLCNVQRTMFQQTKIYSFFFYFFYVFFFCPCWFQRKP